MDLTTQRAPPFAVGSTPLRATLRQVDHMDDSWDGQEDTPEGTLTMVSRHMLESALRVLDQMV
jgi:hypothetical protein